MAERIWMKACITGFSAQPCTLIAAYDSESSILAFTSLKDTIDATRKSGMLIVTNMSRMADYDSLFTAELFGEAIEAYHGLQSCCHYGAEETKRANPDGVIETDGYDENGPKIKISESISNQKVAALAICWLVAGQNATIAAQDIGDEITRFLNGGALTIDGDSADGYADDLYGGMEFNDFGQLGKRFDV